MDMSSIQILKTLADENRFRIIHLLKKRELCACDIEEKLNLSQSGLSYHMKLLVESGLVVKRPQGNWIHYRLNDEHDDVFELVELIFNKE